MKSYDFAMLSESCQSCCTDYWALFVPRAGLVLFWLNTECLLNSVRQICGRLNGGDFLVQDTLCCAWYLISECTSTKRPLWSLVEPAKNIGGLDKHIQHFKYRLPRNRMCLRTPKIKIIISSYIKANCKRNLYELKAKIWLVSKSDTFGDYNIELANKFFFNKNRK